MACCFFFMGRRGELRINDNYFLETKIRATPYKNIKKSRNCVKTIIVNSRIYLFNDNRDNIAPKSISLGRSRKTHDVNKYISSKLF